MRKPTDDVTRCVIREVEGGMSSLTDMKKNARPTDCVVLEPLRKLLSLGLSAEEIEDLDIRQPMLQSICEYARLDEGLLNDPDQARRALKAMMEVMADWTRNLDLQIEMLNMRKKALKRRVKVLDKLASSLEESELDRLAA